MRSTIARIMPFTSFKIPITSCIGNSSFSLYESSNNTKKLINLELSGGCITFEMLNNKKNTNSQGFDITWSSTRFFFNPSFKYLFFSLDIQIYENLFT